MFRFGDCVLDTAARELHCSGTPAAIEPRAFYLLVYLIRNRERTIPKDELLDVLWAGTVVSETSLTRCVMKARHAIKHGHRLTTGVPRFGFQDFFRYIARDQEQGEEHSILIERVWDE